MSQWKQWFGGFLRNWLDALAVSLSKLDAAQQNQFQSALSTVQMPGVDGFAAAWSDLSIPEHVQTTIAEVLGSIEEPDDQQMKSLKTWFTVLMNTIEKQDTKTRNGLLATCGAACASHATNAFREIHTESKDLTDFIQKANEKLCEDEAFYHYVDESTIEIRYPRCLCPLVDQGLISSPVLCGCSSSWLKTNMEAALERPVDVRRINTALDGESSCKFEIMLK